ncbi:hypothetical protein HDU83_005653 [Entophlyctis luteolus]|nr:hypothetical protein HDU83_005653 [Entophlyctis luteolus]
MTQLKKKPMSTDAMSVHNVLDMLPRPPRIRLVGLSGSGKTTLGKRLGSLLDIAHIEEDAIHFVGSDFTLDTAERINIKIADFARTHATWGYVTDGFWKDIHPILLPQINIIIWLDYPFYISFWRLLKRTVWRCWTGEKLWGGETREYFTVTFRIWEEDNIFGINLRSWWRSKVMGKTEKADLMHKWVLEGWADKSELVSEEQVWTGKRILLQFKHPSQLEAWLKGQESKKPDIPSRRTKYD